MTTFQPTTHAPRTRRTTRPNRRRRDRQGSAIILVIVAIVLMAVLGATFVQVARFERISGGGEHIDIAIDSILNEVAVELGKDLYDDNGNFFNPMGSVGDPTNPGGGDEPYDYPWTNDTIPGQRPVTFVDGTGGVAEGGANDDPWLSNTLVDNAGTWAHVSDLTGRFLNYGDKDLRTFGTANPGEVAATAAMVTGLNVTTDSVRLVDADGDGIGDSLWAYAPAAEIAGKRYVYAIRIVDLSARVNVNTALGVTNGAGNPTAAPRGDSPAEIDATRVGYEYGDDAGWTQVAGVADYYQTIGHRLAGAGHGAGLVAWGDASAQRRDFWLYGASQVTAGLMNAGTDTDYLPIDTYGPGDLFELLHRGGLNNDGVQTQLEINAPRLFRAANTEFIYTDAPMGSSPYNFMRNNARRHFTTASGVLGIAPPTGLPGTPEASTLLPPAGERILQADINHSNAAALALVITETLEANGTFDVTNFAHFTDFIEFGSQLAANIVDMRDPDNLLTPLGSQFGMEALPFIAEVYAERAYLYTNPPAIPPAMQAYTALAEADFAIEIRNPFNQPISLEDVYLSVGGSGATPRNLVTDLGAPATLDVGDYVIVYRESSAPGALTGAGRPLEGIPAANLVPTQFPDQWPDAAGSNQVRLHATGQSAPGTALTWGYSAVDIDEIEDVESTTGPVSIPPIPTDPVYFQYSYQGAVDLDMLQILPAGYDTTGHSDPDTPYASPTPTAFGSATKSGGVTLASGASWNTGDQQWLFLDKATSATDVDGRIPYVADVLTIPVVGPNNTNAGAGNQTLAQAIELSAATRLDQFMLEYRTGVAPPAAVVNASQPSLNIPHAVLLLERLTTHNPSIDGEDLDGDLVDTAVGGTPDYDEAFVPGKININTASRELLIAALPYLTDAQRIAVANRIVDFRDNAANFAPAPARPATARSNTLPGIAYTGELYEQLTADLTGLTPQPDWNNHQVGGETDDPYIASPDIATSDIITGDREEDLMLAKWLNEICSTRSDVFAVYMVVQGFPANNFGAGAVESARVVAVFSRANVREVGDKAQLIAVRRVE